jgi:hypothetical protein
VPPLDARDITMSTAQAGVRLVEPTLKILRVSGDFALVQRPPRLALRSESAAACGMHCGKTPLPHQLCRLPCSAPGQVSALRFPFRYRFLELNPVGGDSDVPKLRRSNWSTRVHGIASFDDWLAQTSSH